MTDDRKQSTEKSKSYAIRHAEPKLRLGLFAVISLHALSQSIIREISVFELEEAVLSYSEIIEDYPEDKYGPSCLILGFTKQERPLHILMSHPIRPVLKIITLYEPSPSAWKDNRERIK